PRRRAPRVHPRHVRPAARRRQAAAEAAGTAGRAHARRRNRGLVRALMAAGTERAQTDAPSGGGLVLVALILVAAVANLNLSVANVALPSIGQHFDSSQTMLDLIAV